MQSSWLDIVSNKRPGAGEDDEEGRKRRKFSSETRSSIDDAASGQRSTNERFRAVYSGRNSPWAYDEEESGSIVVGGGGDRTIPGSSGSIIVGDRKDGSVAESGSVADSTRTDNVITVGDVARNSHAQPVDQITVNGGQDNVTLGDTVSSSDVMDTTAPESTIDEPLQVRPPTIANGGLLNSIAVSETVMTDTVVASTGPILVREEITLASTEVVPEGDEIEGDSDFEADSDADDESAGPDSDEESEEESGAESDDEADNESEGTPFESTHGGAISVKQSELRESLKPAGVEAKKDGEKRIRRTPLGQRVREAEEASTGISPSKPRTLDPTPQKQFPRKVKQPTPATVETEIDTTDTSDSESGEEPLMAQPMRVQPTTDNDEQDTEPPVESEVLPEPETQPASVASQSGAPSPAKPIAEEDNEREEPELSSPAPDPYQAFADELYRWQGGRIKKMKKTLPAWSELTSVDEVKLLAFKVNSGADVMINLSPSPPGRARILEIKAVPDFKEQIHIVWYYSRADWEDDVGYAAKVRKRGAGKKPAGAPDGSAAPPVKHPLDRQWPADEDYVLSNLHQVLDSRTVDYPLKDTGGVKAVYDVELKKVIKEGEERWMEYERIWEKKGGEEEEEDEKEEEKAGPSEAREEKIGGEDAEAEPDVEVDVDMNVEAEGEAEADADDDEDDDDDI